MPWSDAGSAIHQLELGETVADEVEVEVLPARLRDMSRCSVFSSASPDRAEMAEPRAHLLPPPPSAPPPSLPPPPPPPPAAACARARCSARPAAAAEALFGARASKAPSSVVYSRKGRAKPTGSPKPSILLLMLHFNELGTSARVGIRRTQLKMGGSGGTVGGRKVEAGGVRGGAFCGQGRSPKIAHLLTTLRNCSRADNTTWLVARRHG